MAIKLLFSSNDYLGLDTPRRQFLENYVIRDSIKLGSLGVLNKAKAVFLFTLAY